MDLSTGIVGLIIGAIIGGIVGLALSVFFEDLLKDRRNHASRWIRSKRSTGPATLWSGTFQIGTLHSPIRMIEGDGEQVINEQSIRIVVNPINVDLPAEMTEWRREFADDQSARAGRGEPHFFNGLNYAVENFVATRTPLDESPEVTLRLKHADYYTFKVGQELDRQFSDGTTPRSRYVRNDQAPDFLKCSFGVNVALVSADNMLIAQRRSNTVGTYPGKWSSSANEGLSRVLDSQGRTSPNLYDVMRRGIAEELAIERSEYHLELLAFVDDIDTYMPGCLFLATLHTLTAADLQQRLGRGRPDGFEHDRVDFIPFEVDSVIQYLLRADRVNEWTPVGPPLFFTALVRRYGRRTVERHVTKIVGHPATT